MIDPVLVPENSPEPVYLSPGEWRIFSLLARRGPLTVRQMLGKLAPAGSEDAPGYTTISTLAQRLVAKGYLTEGPKAAPSGPTSAVLYTPSVPYEDALRHHTERFLAQYALGGEDDLQCIQRVIERKLSS